MLRSLEDLVLPEGCDVAVTVIDNDDTDSARRTVEGATLSMPLAYIHAPGRNISIARNAGLDAASGDYVAFVDDDETVSPNWLQKLWHMAQQEGADVVFGAVQSIYPDTSESWLIEGDYHSTKPPAEGEAVTTGCTANVLIRRACPAVQGLRFDLALGRSGGEDTVYFRRIYQKGGRLRFAADAVVFEKVVPARLSLPWLVQRKFRSGQSHAISLTASAAAPFKVKMTLLIKATAKLVYCVFRALLACFSQKARNFWIIRGALHAGVIVRCLGGRDQVLYGDTGS